MPRAATEADMDSMRTEDDFSGVKSRNGGFGVRTCVFFSFTCGMESDYFESNISKGIDRAMFN